MTIDPLTIAATILAALLAVAWWRARGQLQSLRNRSRDLERSLELVHWSSHEGAWTFDLASQVLRIGVAGVPGDVTSARQLDAEAFRRELLVDEDIAAVDEAIAGMWAGQTAIDLRFRVRYSGQVEYVRVRGRLVEAAYGGSERRYAGCYKVITRGEMERQRTSFLDAVVLNSTHAVVALDESFRIRYANVAALSLIGQTQAELLNQDLTRLVAAGDAGALQAMLLTLGRGEAYRGELPLLGADGATLATQWRAEPLHNHGSYAYVGVFEDVTAQRRAEANLKFLSGHDALTGLPNRRALQGRLEQAIRRYAQDPDHLALLYLDLDRFKVINDSLGHGFGDELLRRAGERMVEVAGSRERVARLGGDEFAVILEGANAAERAELMAARFVDSFSRPLGPRSVEVVLTPSIGLALFPQHGHNAEELLRGADAAMYAAKDQGRNCWAWYTQSIADKANERARLESGLRRALERNELYLVYQPKMDLKQHRLTGVEALLRWRNPEIGEVPPAKFIPIAEELGLIVEMGEWVLYQAARQALDWSAAGMEGIKVAVNLSLVQLQRSSPAAFLQSMISHLGMSPAMLSVELTESRMLADPERSIRLLHELREVGVGLAIDDFGTGYSSLDYLRKLPVDTLKIDKSFVQAIDQDRDGAVLAQTIVLMGKTMRLTTVAEGVEQPTQVQALMDFGCDEIQGYWLSPPLQADRLQAFWLRHQMRPRMRVLQGGKGESAAS